MASAKVAWRWVAAGAAVACYCAYLVYDQLTFTYENRREIVRAHLRNAQMHRRVDGVILGGSNGVFGLSAQQLSAESGANWYNASLLNEGFSLANYRSYAARIAAALDADAVQTVVFTTFLPYSLAQYYENRDSTKTVHGSQLGLKPNQSLGSLLKERVQGKVIHSYPLPTRWGDLDFAQYKCSNRWISTIPADTATAARILLDRAEVAAEHFPRAEVVVVLPSVLSAALRDNPAAFTEAQVRAAFTDGVRKSPRLRSRQVRLLIQQRIPSGDLVCDALHHPTEAGRTWRTRELGALLKEQSARH
jgi:hypothetical protein